MAKRWRIHPHDPDAIASLGRTAGVPAVVAQLLVSRGISDAAQARRFLDARLSDLRDPEALPGCPCAAERIHDAIRSGRRIVIYGDYDVDGITGTAILRQCIKLLGGNVGYYVPNRIEEGYGLNDEAIRRLVGEQAQVIVTVDCGITSMGPVRTANACGVEMIVTDHHEPGTELPEASAIVHPSLPGTDYPFAGLSGAGVALKLAWAVCQRASGAKRVAPAMKEFLLQAVGLAAMGTVADVVPLIDENRVLVRHGLVSLKQQPTLGMAALMRIAQLGDKPRLESDDIGFTLGPRINAAGRMGQAQLAVEMLVTDCPKRAEELAQYIDGLNTTRQTLERSMYLAANKQAQELFDPEQDAALVLADHDWHRGVLGIVAGRLAEKYHRPVILISWDRMNVKPGMGSARSIAGFNLHAALAACGEYLVTHGGHAAAAGLTIRPEHLESFRAAFCALASEAIAQEQRTAELWIDAEMPFGACTLDVIGMIERMAPFGQGNHRPLLCTTGVRLSGPPRAIGSGGRHLSMRLVQHETALRAVAFGGGDWAEDLTAVDGSLDVAFRPVINTFRGQRNVELQLVDWRKPQT